MTKNDKTRMIQWIMLAFILYLLAFVIKESPQVSTGLWKAGHITSGAFMGYWVDRHLYGRVTPESAGHRTLARAIVVSAAILGMAFGL